MKIFEMLFEMKVCEQPYPIPSEPPVMTATFSVRSSV